MAKVNVLHSGSWVRLVFKIIIIFFKNNFFAFFCLELEEVAALSEVRLEISVGRVVRQHHALAHGQSLCGDRTSSELRESQRAARRAFRSSRRSPRPDFRFLFTSFHLF